MSIHDQAHRLTVKRLGHVDSCYVSRFCKVCSYVIPEVHLTSLRVTIISIKSLSWCECRCLMWFKLYTNEVFRKREKIAITVVYYKYTTSSDLTILCSFMLHYYSIKETTVWYGNVYLYIQLLQLLEDLFGSYVYVARLGTKF